MGAGLGGLTLANVLHVGGIASAIYDLDASPTARPQGGQLDIHLGTGQAALRAAGLHDAFLRIVHAGAEATRVLDRNGGVVHEDEGTGDRPEVDRGRLRSLLVDALPASTMRWGKKLVDVAARADGTHALRFADGASVTCDLLVGGDGAWSRVRPLVSAAKPTYTGMSYIECYVRDAATKEPACAALVGKGALLALAPDRGIMVHKEGDGSLHVYVAVRAPESWLASIDFGDVAAAKRDVLAELAGWDPAILALVDRATGPLVPRPIHTLPVGHRWEHRRGVTLVGDAAHLSPPAGEGANLAMFDGAELGRALVEHPADIDAAVRAFEDAMFPRGETAAHGALDVVDRCFGPDAPHALVAMFTA